MERGYEWIQNDKGSMVLWVNTKWNSFMSEYKLEWFYKWIQNGTVLRVNTKWNDFMSEYKIERFYD